MDEEIESEEPEADVETPAEVVEEKAVEQESAEAKE